MIIDSLEINYLYRPAVSILIHTFSTCLFFKIIYEIRSSFTLQKCNNYSFWSFSNILKVFLTSSCWKLAKLSTIKCKWVTESQWPFWMSQMRALWCINYFPLVDYLIIECIDCNDCCWAELQAMPSLPDCIRSGCVSQPGGSSWRAPGGSDQEITGLEALTHRTVRRKQCVRKWLETLDGEKETAGFKPWFKEGRRSQWAFRDASCELLLWAMD